MDEQQAARLPKLTFGEPEPPVIVSTSSETWFNASVEHVWNKTWLEMDAWWPHRFKPESSVHADMKLGGHWAEHFPGGQGGAVYGIFTYIDPLKLVGMVGKWGMFGATWSGGYWKFVEQDGGTLISTHGEIMGLVPDEALEGRKSGSKMLMERLVAWVEEGRGRKDFSNQSE